MPVERPYNPKPKKISQLIQSNLFSVGIHAEIIKIKDFDTYWEQSAYGEHELMMDGWVADYIDPDPFIYILLSKENTEKGAATNLAFFKDDESNDLLLKAHQTIGPDKRADFYYKAQEIIHRKVPNIPIAYFNQYLASQKTVHGIRLGPSGNHCFKKTWIAE